MGEINVFVDSASLKPFDASMNQKMFNDLNLSLGKVFSILSLTTITGFALLIINDCVDSAPDNFNYQKFKIKCLVGTALIALTTIFFYSAYNRVNDDFDALEKSHAQPPPKGEYLVKCQTTVRASPKLIAKVLCEQVSEWKLE